MRHTCGSVGRDLSWTGDCVWSRAWRDTSAGWWRCCYSLPDDGVLAGLVLGFSLHTDHLHAAGVEGRGDTHLWGRQHAVRLLLTRSRISTKVLSRVAPNWYRGARAHIEALMCKNKQKKL